MSLLPSVVSSDRTGYNRLMTTQVQTLQEIETGTKRGQRVASRAAKDQLAYWKSRVVYRAYRKGETVSKVRNLQVRIKHAGREGWFNLNTDNVTEAAKKAVTIYLEIKVNGWEAANTRFKPKPQKYAATPTLGEFFQAFREQTELGDKTVASYCRKFRGIVAGIFKIGGSAKEKFTAKDTHLWRQKVDSVELASITPERIEQWRRQYIERRGSSPIARKHAKNSADSAIRCAKAFFGKRVLSKLKGFSLPVPLPFDGVSVSQIHNPYQSQMDPRFLLATASRELREQHPEAYKIFLLSLHAGLRRNETDKLRWESILWEKRLILIQTTDTFAAKTQGSEAGVPMNQLLWDELRSFRPTSNVGYVIESLTAARPTATYNHYRAEKHFAILNAWLKGKGVKARCPIHTLRKELGSIVADKMSLVAAQQMLRHKDVTTTARYYVSLKSDIGEVLTNFMKAGEETTPPPAEAGSKPDSLCEAVLTAPRSPSEGAFLKSDEAA